MSQRLPSDDDPTVRLHRGRWSMRFVEPFESMFVQETLWAARTQFRANILIFVVAAAVTCIYGMTAFADVMARPTVAAAIVVMFGVSVAHIGWTFYRGFWRFYDLIVPIGAVVQHGAIAFLSAALPDASFLVSYPAMLLVVLLNSTLRVRFSSLVVMQLATSSLWLYTIFERGVYLSVTGKPIAVVFFFAVVLAISLATGRAFEVMARREFSVKLALGLERENADKLLRNVMPDRIATRIKGGEAAIADFHGEATVMFADLSGFTAMASNCSPRELVNLLNDLYSRFDDLTNQFGLEKLKTIGDAYMAVAGLEDQHGPHAAKAADCALAMLADLEAFNAAHGTQLALRVGLHTGPLIAGIVGKRQFAYDVWGDTVNVASRMESHGEPGRIQISEATYKHVRTTHRCANAGEKPVKGKGLMKTWFVNGRRGAYAAAILEAS